MSNYLSDCTQKQLDRWNAFPFEKTGALGVHAVKNGIVVPINPRSHIEPRDGGVFASITPRYTPPAAAHLGTTTGEWEIEPFSKDCHYWPSLNKLMVRFGKAPDEAGNIKKRDESVVYLGHLDNHFGHFLTDSLSRLWFLLDKANAQKKVCYIADTPEHPYIEFLYLFGLKQEQMIWINEVTQFAEVIVPEPSFRYWDYFHKDYKRTCDKIRESVSGAYNYKKVYFSRNEYVKGAFTFGELPIEQTFARKGYKVFYPDRLSMKQKLKILANCEYFAGTSGTGMHNILWCKDGITCLQLNRSPCIMPVQIMIDKMKGLNTEYIDAYLDIFPTGDWGYPDIVGLNTCLKQFFEDNGFCYRQKDFKDELGKALYHFFRYLYPAIEERGLTFDYGLEKLPYNYAFEPMQDTFPYKKTAQKAYDAISEYDFATKPSLPSRCAKLLFKCVYFPFRCVRKVYRMARHFFKRFKCIRNIYYPLKALLKK